MAVKENRAGVEDTETLITHTTDIVVSFIANNSIDAREVPSLIQNVHATLAGLGSGELKNPVLIRRFPFALRSRRITSSVLRTARSSRCSNVT